MASPKDLAAAAAYADTSTLEDFDGRSVVRSQIKVTNTGDGLSAAMAVAPEALHHGQEVVIIMRGVVTSVGFAPLDPDDDDSALVRVHTIKAGTATIADEVTVRKVAKSLETQDDRIRRAVEAAAGVHRLEGIDGDGEGGEPGDDDTGEPADL